MIHRGDLQAALLDEVRAHPAITLALARPVDGFAIHGERVTLPALGALPRDGAVGLVGADGLWSRCARKSAKRPSLASRAAPPGGALVPSDAVAAEFRADAIHLWLGRGSHPGALSGEGRPG